MTLAGGPGAGAAAEHEVWGLLVVNHPCAPSPGSSPTSAPSGLLLLLTSSPLQGWGLGTSPFSWLQAMKQSG